MGKTIKIKGKNDGCRKLKNIKIIRRDRKERIPVDQLLHEFFVLLIIFRQAAPIHPKRD